MCTPLRKCLRLLFITIILIFGCRKEELEFIIPEETARSFDRPVTGLYTFGNTLIAGVGNSKDWGFEGSGFQIYAFDGNNWRNILKETIGQIGDIQEFQGELYLTGRFDTISGLASPNLVRWDGENWKPVGNGIDYGTSGDITFDFWYSIGGLSLEVLNGKLYIGGGSLEGKNNLVEWDGSKITSLIEYPDGAWCKELVVFQDQLYGGVSVTEPFLARFNGIGWSRVSPETSDWSIMEVHGDKLFGPLGIWTGTHFERFDYPVTVSLINSIGNDLYVTAHFTQINTIMRWDGQEWYPYYQPPTGWEIFSMAEYLGEIYIGGEFVQDVDTTLHIMVLE